MKKYTVWFVDGLECSDTLLTWSEALKCKKYWKKRGYETKIQLVKI